MAEERFYLLCPLSADPQPEEAYFYVAEGKELAELLYKLFNEELGPSLADKILTDVSASGVSHLPMMDWPRFQCRSAKDLGPQIAALVEQEIQEIRDAVAGPASGQEDDTSPGEGVLSGRKSSATYDTVNFHRQAMIWEAQLRRNGLRYEHAANGSEEKKFKRTTDRGLDGTKKRSETGEETCYLKLWTCESIFNEPTCNTSAYTQRDEEEYYFYRVNDMALATKLVRLFEKRFVGYFEDPGTTITFEGKFSCVTGADLDEDDCFLTAL